MNRRHILASVTASLALLVGALWRERGAGHFLIDNQTGCGDGDVVARLDGC